MNNSEGRQHWKGLILNLGANDCKENQEEQLTMTGYDGRYITWIGCMEMIFKNWNKLEKYTKQQIETDWKETFISKEKDIYNI